MTYIKLEDAINLVKLDERYEWTLERLNSLPSIDFEEMIKEKFEMCREQASDSERHF